MLGGRTVLRQPTGNGKIRALGGKLAPLSVFFCKISAENSVRSISKASHGAGLGYASQIERISMVYEQHELGVPNSIIAKLPTNAANTRALATLFKLYINEVMFYKTLAPTVDILTPECFWAEIEEISLTEKFTNYIVNFLPEKLLLRMLDKSFKDVL